MASQDYTQGGQTTSSRRTNRTPKSHSFASDDWPRTSEPQSRPSPRWGRHGGIESSDVRPSSSHLRQPPSVSPTTTPTDSISASTSTTTIPDRPTISRRPKMRVSGTSARGPPRPTTLSHHRRPICVLEEGSDDGDDTGDDDDDDDEEVVVPTFRSRSKSLHRESRRTTRSRSAHPFRSRSESRFPESRRDVSPRSANPFRSRSQSRYPASRRDASPRSGHPYRSTPDSRRSQRTSLVGSDNDTDVSSVADDKALQTRNKILDPVPVGQMSLHERLNRGRQGRTEQSPELMEETQIYHVPSVGDDPPPSHRSSRKRDEYRRPRARRDDYDDDFEHVYHHETVEEEHPRSSRKRPSRKYYPSEGFISKPASSLKRSYTTGGSHLASSHSIGSSTKRSHTFVGNFSGNSLQPVAEPRRVSCIVCMDEERPVHKTAKLKCGHRMCHKCLVRNFKLSVSDPQNMPPKCCTADHIPLKHVAHLLEPEFKMKWNRKFAEYSNRNRIYCPLPRCDEWIRPEDIRTGDDGRGYAKCRSCRTKVCCSCGGRWHYTRECPRDEETNQLLEQAKREGWQRCHRCKNMVELKEGCNHMTCRCGAEFCMVCGSKWKSCECPWFNAMDDPLEHIQIPPHANSRSYPYSTPRFGSGLPSPPSPPRDFRSEQRPSVTETLRPRPSISYEEEELQRHLREQREAHAQVPHHKMPSYAGFEPHDDLDDYDRNTPFGYDQRSRPVPYMEDRPSRRRAATVVAPSPPQSRQQTFSPPHSTFERPNTGGTDYAAAAAWTRQQLYHSPDRYRPPSPDRRRPPSPSRYRYPSPERHHQPPSPERHHRPADPDRMRTRSPDRPDMRRKSSHERRLADRFSGSRATAHSAPIGPHPGMSGMMGHPMPMMGAPMSPMRPGGVPPPHAHPPVTHPMHAHHHPYPGAPLPPPHPHGPPPMSVSMAPAPGPGAPMPPRMQMQTSRTMEITDDFFNGSNNINNRSTRSLEQQQQQQAVATMSRRGTGDWEQDPTGGGGGTGSPHAPSVKRRPAPGQATREHHKQENTRSVQAGLTGPGRGMDRVNEWRNYVEPGLPEGEYPQSVISGS